MVAGVHIRQTLIRDALLIHKNKMLVERTEFDGHITVHICIPKAPN